MEAARTLELVRVKLDQHIGTELGGYRILEQLGRGGTSVVYRAEHVRLGRPAALKLLSPGLGESDFSDRFLRESRLAASLDHPSIVPVYDAGEQDGLLYIAMACIDGSDLKTLLAREGRLPVRRALRIVGQVASVNAHLHAAPPKLDRVAPGVPPALAHVVAKALSKSPLDRYATCGEFV